jgi:hypothetical protein
LELIVCSDLNDPLTTAEYDPASVVAQFQELEKMANSQTATRACYFMTVGLKIGLICPKERAIPYEPGADPKIEIEPRSGLDLKTLGETPGFADTILGRFASPLAKDPLSAANLFTKNPFIDDLFIDDLFIDNNIKDYILKDNNSPSAARLNSIAIGPKSSAFPAAGPYDASIMAFGFDYGVTA